MNSSAPGSSRRHIRGVVKQVGLRNWLLIPVVAASLPLAIFAGIVVYMLWQYQQVQQRHVETVRALAVAVGKEIQTTVTLLQHLAMLNQS